MSHEFRTPLNSIIALARLLLDHSDGPLNEEQNKQLQFIRKAAQDLTELVNDLLDLAKVEAGKTEVKPGKFSIPTFFGALRGMLRPLLVAESVALIFDEPENVPELFTDEGKVSQIIRNFIANALKFTERGEVRVSAKYDAATERMTISVADTGVGIAASDQERIFQEFTQVDNPLQHKVKGTGLGLPLSKKLANLLGGSVTVRSELGKGSVFALDIPVRYCAPPAEEPEPVESVQPGQLKVLVVEDSVEDKLIYEKLFRGTQFALRFAETVEQARRTIRHEVLSAVILDIRLRAGDTWQFLAELKSHIETQALPVIVASSIDDQVKAASLGANAYILKPVRRSSLLHTLEMLLGFSRARKILIVDDDATTRYILSNSLTDPHHMIFEADNGRDGLRITRQEHPDVIILDLVMPELTGFDVLDELKSANDTRDIPVIIHTSKKLTETERGKLSDAAAIVSKDSDEAIGAIWDVLLKTGDPFPEAVKKE
jgi:CheY-like chemotaxis protein